MAGRLIAGGLRSLYRAAWIAAGCLLVIMALYASLGRYYIQYVPGYAPQLVQWVHDQTGAELNFEGLRTRWSGLSPVLELDRVTLSYEGAPAATISGGYGKVGIISGLVRRGFVDLLELNAGTLELHFYETEKGWHFAGQPLVNDSPSQFDFISTVMGIREAEISALSVTLHYANGESANLWGQRLRLQGGGDFRRLKAGLGIEGSKATRLIAELSGDPRTPDFSLATYLRLENSSFASVAPLFGRYKTLAEIEGRGELWFSLNGRGRASWQGQIQVPELHLGELWASDQVLSSANLTFSGTLRNGLARTWFSALDFFWEQQYVDWSGTQLSYHRQQGNRLQIGMPSLDIGLTQKRLTDSGALPGSLVEVLSELEPQGRIKSLLVDIPLDTPSALRIRGELARVALESWRGIPAARGVDGFIDTGINGGELTIRSPDFQLGLAPVYENPLKLQSFTTRLRWSLEDELLTIRSSEIAALDRGAMISARIALDIPVVKDAENDPQMALLVGLSNGHIGLRDQYLPALLEEGLTDWLAQSIRGGEVDRAVFLYHGSLTRSGQKTMQLAVQGRELALDYHPDWPALSHADFDLWLDGKRVTVRTEKARVFDNVALSNIDVSIGEREDVMMLGVRADATSPLNSALRLVRESALRQQVGATFDDWRGVGRVDARLSLDIPLASGVDPQVRVDTRIKASQLRMQNLNLELTNVRGPLLFESSAGIASERIDAELFGRPVTVGISQRPDKPVLVNARGAVDVTDIRHWLQQPLLGFASGVATFNIDISAGAERTYLKASSDLFGVAIDLPGSLGKPVDQSRLLELDIPLSEKPLSLDLSIDGLGRLMLAFDDVGSLSGGSFSVGGQSIPPPPRDQFMIVGELAYAELEQWQIVLDRYLAMSRSNEPTDGGGGAAQTQALPIVVEDLAISQLDGVGRTWQDVIIDANNGVAGKGPWQVSMQSRRLLGTLEIPASGPLVIALQHFNLPPLNGTADAVSVADTGEAESLDGSLLSRIDLNAVPEVDFSVQSLTLDGDPLGKLAFNLRKVDGGITLSDIRGNLRGLRLGGDARPLALTWTREGKQDYTALTGQVSVTHIGDVLNNWQFERVMESRRGLADLALSWPGAPDRVAADRLSGTIVMEFDNGRFLRGSDAASGTLRMVGLLNFANVIRRLQFNFKDVFEKGIHYDTIRGTMRFEDGVMRTPKALEIDGPSSVFRISGLLDFNTDQTDMELLATLPLGSNLPWVAAFVSGLPVAAGVYIASKLFETQVDKASTLVYSVKGPWQQPELEFKRLFGESLSIEMPKEPTKPKVMRRGRKK